MQAETQVLTLSNAIIHEDSSETLVVRPSAAPWLGAGLFGLVALGLLWLGSSTLVLAIFVFAAAVYVLLANPLSTRFVVDAGAGEAVYQADYLAHRPRHVEARWPLSQIAQVGLRPRSFVSGYSVDLLLADGTQIVLQFGRRGVSAERFLTALGAFRSAAGLPALQPLPAGAPRQRRVSQAQMLRDVRAWGFWLLIMGAAQLVAAQGFSAWGVLLIAIGVASFFLREPSMFMIYAVTIAWAGLSNLIYGDGLWKVFSVLQAVWAYQLFKQFMKYRPTPAASAQNDPAGPPAAPADPLGRSAALFPLLALSLGGASLGAVLLSFGGAFLNGLAIHNAGLNPILGGLMIMAVYAGLLGLATGLAGWLAAYPRRWASVLGSLAGILTLVIYFGIVLLARLA